MASLSEDQLQGLLDELEDWEVMEDYSETTAMVLQKSYKLPSFHDSVDFVNQIADLCSADHHPDIGISNKSVMVTLYTISEGGLSVADFDLAAKIDRLLS